jgi:hypothetical protein
LATRALAEGEWCAGGGGGVECCAGRGGDGSHYILQDLAADKQLQAKSTTYSATHNSPPPSHIHTHNIAWANHLDWRVGEELQEHASGGSLRGSARGGIRRG